MSAIYPFGDSVSSIQSHTKSLIMYRKTITSPRIWILALACVCFSANATAQWSTGVSGTLNDLNTTWRIGADVVLVGGVGGTLLRSTDGGLTFSPAAGGFFDDVNEIQFVDDLTGYAVADNGRFLRSADGGASWTVSFIATGSNLAGMHFRDAMNGHVVGRDGVIFQTTDGGTTWVPQASGSTERLESVFFVDANNGFVAGRNDTYLQTSDGGATWNGSTLLGTGRDLNDVFFISTQSGFIASDNGFLLRTVDGGANWTNQNTGTVQNLNEVYFIDAANGYLAGDVGLIQASTDGGLTWITEASGTTSNLEDIHFSLIGRGASAGANGTVAVRNDAIGCNAPIVGLNSTITTAGVSFFWSEQAGATAYEIQGGQVGFLPKRKEVASNAFSLGGGAFIPGASYNWRVRAVCGAVTGPYSETEVFSAPIARKQSTANPLSVYPNPAVDQVTVKLPESGATIRVFTLDGREVLAQQPTQTSTVTLSLMDVPVGTYIIEAVGQNIRSHQLLVVQ